MSALDGIERVGRPGYRTGKDDIVGLAEYLLQSFDDDRLRFTHEYRNAIQYALVAILIGRRVPAI